MVWLTFSLFFLGTPGVRVGWLCAGSLTLSILTVLLYADRMWVACSPAGLTLGKDSIPEGA